MSDYNIQISWSGKDSLPDADPAKVISGNDFQVEFEAIRTALNSKAEATELLNLIYPVGSIYTNATNGSNPASLLGFGTWTAFGSGRVPVGFNASDSNFDTAEKTGGSKDAITVEHTHTGSTAVGGSSGTFGMVGSAAYPSVDLSESSGAFTKTGTQVTKRYDGSSGSYSTFQYYTYDGDHTHDVTVESTGSSGTDANLQPYITVYMWKRTA